MKAIFAGVFFVFIGTGIVNGQKPFSADKGVLQHPQALPWTTLPSFPPHRIQSARDSFLLRPVVFERGKDHVWNGIVIGGAVGGATSFILFEILSHGDAWPSRSISFGAVIGGFVGWVIDRNR